MQMIYGIHPVLTLLKQSTHKIKKLYINQNRKDNRLTEIQQLAETQDITVSLLSLETIKKHFGDIKHQGVIAEVYASKSLTEADIPTLLAEIQGTPLILILDGITDPHNLGACLRSADAAGVHCVIAPKDNSADITPIVSKVASGAAETMPFIRVTNLVRTIKALKESGIWVYGAAGEAKSSIYTLDFRAATAIVMGAEGKGLRRLTRESCDGLFALPMQGHVQSLNVSVAAGISLYEVSRQRLI